MIDHTPREFSALEVTCDETVEEDPPDVVESSLALETSCCDSIVQENCLEMGSNHDSCSIFSVWEEHWHTEAVCLHDEPEQDSVDVGLDDDHFSGEQLHCWEHHETVVVVVG